MPCERKGKRGSVHPFTQREAILLAQPRGPSRAVGSGSGDTPAHVLLEVNMLKMMKTRGPRRVGSVVAAWLGVKCTVHIAHPPLYGVA